LHYTIRFQNTGNFPATDVVLKDTLSNKLDLASFKLEQASHPVQYTIAPGGIITFTFHNIFLPDSTSDLLNSQGFVRFSITPGAAFNLGETILNKASIYFDQNDPIVTNSTATILEKTSNTTENTLVKPVLVFPNPSFDQIRIQVPDSFANERSEVLIINQVGQVVRTIPDFDSRSAIKVKSFPAGIYMIYLRFETGLLIGKWNKLNE
jgi:hypothetical protein